MAATLVAEPAHLHRRLSTGGEVVPRRSNLRGSTEGVHRGTKEGQEEGQVLRSCVPFKKQSPVFLNRYTYAYSGAIIP